MKRETTSKKNILAYYSLEKGIMVDIAEEIINIQKQKTNTIENGQKISICFFKEDMNGQHTMVINAIFSDSEYSNICCTYLNKLARQRLQPCLALTRKPKNKGAK